MGRGRRDFRWGLIGRVVHSSSAMRAGGADSMRFKLLTCVDRFNIERRWRMVQSGGVCGGIGETTVGERQHRRLEALQDLVHACRKCFSEAL